MSNQDSFIDEVSEEVRRDKLFGYLRKYGWIGVLVVLLLVGGTAWTEFRSSQSTSQAEATGDAILDALRIEDDAERAEALASVPAEGDAAVVADLLQAANLEETGDGAGAVEVLEAIALNPDIPAIYRDLATLKSVMLSTDALSDEDRRARLVGLATPGAPFRLLAEEQLAYLDLDAGEDEAARERFIAIAQDAEVTQGLRDRAFSMIVALGGDPAALLTGAATQ